MNTCRETLQSVASGTAGAGIDPKLTRTDSAGPQGPLCMRGLQDSAPTGHRPTQRLAWKGHYEETLGQKK